MAKQRMAWRSLTARITGAQTAGMLIGPSPGSRRIGKELRRPVFPGCAADWMVLM